MPDVDVLVEAVVAVGPDELDLLPDLRLVANYGVGYDRVDVAACRERGVAVTNTPGVLDAAVADLTLALILACRRHLVAVGPVRPRGPLAARLGTARAARPRPRRARRSASSGFGRIGPRSPGARRRSGCAVVHPPPQRRRSRSTSCSASSDVVSLHVPLTPETRRPHLARAARAPPGRRDARQHRARSDRGRGARSSTSSCRAASRRASTSSPTSPVCRSGCSTSRTSCSRRTSRARRSRRERR